MVVCPGCDAINRDGVGACERCGSPIAAVCIQCGAGNPALARFCCGCGARLDASPQSGAPGRAERRQITVMFCDLVGSSGLAQHLGPEEWHQLLNRVHSQCGEIVARHHGHVAQYLGDGLLAYFGYPVAAEDAARQAAAAGLKISEKVSEIGLETGQRLRVRVGVHTGSVVIGNVGSRIRQESLALGDTPNIAARIQEVAAPSSVVLSADTYRLVEGYFETRGLGEHTLKGVSQAIKLHQVLSEKDTASRIEAVSAAVGLTPFVGRRLEWAAIDDAWSRALEGNGSALALVGEPGIGKSRLIHLLTTRLGSGVAVIQIRSSEHARSTAFYSVLECLQRRARIRHGEPASEINSKLNDQFEPLGLTREHVAAVGTLLGVPLDQSLELSASRLRAAMLEAFSTWVAGHPDADPRLIILEDLHWADPSSLESLSLVLDRVASRKLLIVLSARPEFVSPWASDRVKTLPLGRLDAEDARTVIGRIAGDHPLPGEIVDRLIGRAEGIPLFLEEMTKATLESGLLRQTTAGYVLENSMLGGVIPTTLHDSLMGRLDHLGQNKPLAQLAAVLGREFTYPLFRAVWQRLPSAPAIDLAKGLDHLVQAQLLAHAGGSGDETYQFRHSLLQDAAYQSLLRSVQRVYHLHAANALVEESPARAEAEPEVIARHFSAANQNEKAVEYWSKAGEHAISASAYVEAIAHFGAALEQLDNVAVGPPRVRHELDLRSRLGVALITTRGFAATEVEETYGRASDLCAELGDEAPYRVLYGVWVVILIRGHLTSTQRMVQHLERLVTQRSDVESAVIGNAMLGAWAFFRGDYAEAVKRNSAAIGAYDLARPKEQHSALLLKHGFEGMLWPALFLALCRTIQGDPAGARRTWQDAADLGERVGDPYVSVGVLAFGALMNHELGDLETAAELSQRARELAEQKGFTYWASIATIINGSCSLAGGPTDASIATIEGGLKLLKMIGDRSIYIHYMSYLANAYLKNDRPDSAVDVLQEALGLARVHIARFCEPELLRLLGEAHAARGELDAARDCLSSALELSRRDGACLYELRIALTLARLLRSEKFALVDRTALARAREKFHGSAEFPLLGQVDLFLADRETLLERTLS